MSAVLALLLALPLPLPLQEPSDAAAALQTKVDEILPRVAQLRGWDFRHTVHAGIKTIDEFMADARKEIDEDYGEERFHAMSQSYGLFGLIDPGTELLDAFAELLRGQVGGYYDPATKSFYMIDAYNDGFIADVILAHELTHALDDQHYPLDDLLARAKGSSDHEFAVRAVVEGSGTSLMNLYTMRGAVQGWLDLSSGAEEAAEMMEAQSESLELAPPYLVLTLSLPYMLGNKLLARQDNMGVAMLTEPADADLRHAFENPPLSSEQVLHLEKYWDPEQRDDPVKVVLPDFSSALGADWSRTDEDTLGEIGCYVLTAESLPSLADPGALMLSSFTNSAAAGWDGDRYYLYAGPGDALVMVWASEWDSAAEAEEFVQSIEMIGAENSAALREVVRKDTAVIVLYANDAGAPTLPKLLESVRKARPDWR
ncbi:MAG TPA: hypothetical protein VGC54_03210 [Planctomycetota bacterium]